jgi:hypothetical protein
MKELLYTILELEGWNKKTCDFCSNLFGDDNKAVCQIRTRNPLTDELVSNDVVCENCKEKFENDELPKCGNCGRLLDKTYRDILSKKYVCDCEGKEQEKELPSLPHERESMTSFYERQINGLREQLTTAEITIEEEREAHEDFMRVSEEWSKRQKQELLDQIKELETEVERLKKQTPQALVDEIESYKKEIESLKIQLEQLTSQQTAQIEVKEVKKWPWRLKK